MPQFDKTGPEGKGPGTGRGVGDCTEEEKKEYKQDKGRKPSKTDIPKGSDKWKVDKK